MSEAGSAAILLMHKLHSDFKARCQEHGVWDRYVEHSRAMKVIGKSQLEANDVLIPVWEGCLSWLEEGKGNTREGWDFDKFRPIGSLDEGAFERFTIIIRRESTIHDLIMEERVRSEVLSRSGKSKDGPIISDDAISVGGIAGIQLRTPNSKVSRSDEINWAYHNLFEYQSLMAENKSDKARYLMEGAPTFGACSWLAFAYSNPSKFMSDLNKNSPEEEGISAEDQESQSRYSELLTVMEQDFKINCPTCSSKF